MVEEGKVPALTPHPPSLVPKVSGSSTMSSGTRSSSSTAGSRHHNPRKKRISLKFHAKNFVKTRNFGEALTEHYDIGAKIGEGGFGEVFAVVHKTTGADRAVKIIYKAEDDDDQFEKVNATIRNEFATVNSLDHPNLIKQYEMFEDEDRFMIVTGSFASFKNIFIVCCLVF